MNQLFLSTLNWWHTCHYQVSENNGIRWRIPTDCSSTVKRGVETIGNKLVRTSVVSRVTMYVFMCVYIYQCLYVDMLLHHDSSTCGNFEKVKGEKSLRKTQIRWSLRSWGWDGKTKTVFSTSYLISTMWWKVVSFLVCQGVIILTHFLWVFWHWVSVVKFPSFTYRCHLSDRTDWG